MSRIADTADFQKRKQAMEWWTGLGTLNIIFTMNACGIPEERLGFLTRKEIEEMYDKMHEPITLNKKKEEKTYTEEDMISFANYVWYQNKWNTEKGVKDYFKEWSSFSKKVK